MLPLDDPKWSELHGGYRKPYDARSLLRRFSDVTEEASCWGEVWNKLHHQDDIGEASYAVLPNLVMLFDGRKRDFNLYGYAATLEECRGRGNNPELPDWLSADYRVAQDKLLDLAVADLRSGVSGVDLRAILSFVASYCGSPGISAVLTNLGHCEDALAILGEYGESLHD